VTLLEALRGAADPHGVMVQGALLGATPPSAPGFALPAEGALDATSRLLWHRADAPLSTARARAAAGGFSLPLPDAPTVREALARALALDAPATRRITSWPGTPGGCPTARRRWWLPCPRRAAGPDVLSMVLRDNRFGAIDAVALRVVGDDERGPRELAPAVTLPARRSASLDAWTERAATRGGV
jgi:hypothetical protein